MQRTRVRRVGALVLGLSLVAAACGGDDDDDDATGTEAPSGGTEAPTDETDASGGTEAPTDETDATDSTDDTGSTEGTDGTGASAGTVEGDPSCTGESDGVLRIATVLPETGNLAFLGPPEFAGAELAVQDINAAGGVLGQDVQLDQGDSGDTTTDIANQTVDRQLASGADVFIGAASSGVSSTFVDKLIENCKIQFSPANTSALFTSYEDDDLYFRTAPPDRFQGRVVADLMLEEGVTNVVMMALQDPYGEGLLDAAAAAFADGGGEVLDTFLYDPNAPNFQAEVDRVVSADTEALLLIGFEESAQILTGLFEAGFTVDAGKRIFFVDGNIGNALGEQLPPGSLEGQRGTTPMAAELTDEFRQAMLAIDPALQDFNYGPETYDAIIISALAAIAAGTDDPAEIARHINGITRDGTTCTTFAECVELLEAGEDIDYDGPAGPMTFAPEGEPSEANYAILTFDAQNTLDTIDSEFVYITD